MSFFHKDRITAKLVGTNLVASFSCANPPLIWKFDLERNHSFTIALQGEEGDWELGITSPKGEFYPVTHFLSREDAEEAMAKVEKTLTKKRRAKGSLLLKLLVFLLIMLILVFFACVGFGVYLVKHPDSALSYLTPSLPLEQGLKPAEPIPGVPIPADQILNPPN